MKYYRLKQGESVVCDECHVEIRSPYGFWQKAMTVLCQKCKTKEAQ